MKTILFDDHVTSVMFDGEDEVTLTMRQSNGKPFVVKLDLDEVDRLLAVREHAVDPVLDLEEFFHGVGIYASAHRMAEAFIAAAGSLGEIVYGT